MARSEDQCISQWLLETADDGFDEPAPSHGSIFRSVDARDPPGRPPTVFDESHAATVRLTREELASSTRPRRSTSLRK